MSSPTHNFFDVVDPHLYECTVWSYRVGHSLMLVRATRSWSEPGTFFYLTFESVQYFEGPLRWTGAGFYVAATEECAALLRRTGVRLSDEYVEMSDDFLDYLLGMFRLFVVELANNVQVKILAASAGKTSDIPPNFYWLAQGSARC